MIGCGEMGPVAFISSQKALIVFDGTGLSLSSRLMPPAELVCVVLAAAGVVV